MSPVKAGSVAVAPPGDGGGFSVGGLPMWAPRTQTWLYKALFHHVGRLVSTGYARRLEPSDLFEPSELKMDRVRRQHCHPPR